MIVKLKAILYIMRNLTNYIKNFLKKFLSSSTRDRLKRTKGWLNERVDLLLFWRWEIVRLPQVEGSTNNILYFGRKKNNGLAKVLLGINENSSYFQLNKSVLKQKVVISEMPFPGLLCVPKYLRAIVTLGNPIEEIMAGFDRQLRSNLKKNRSLYSIKQVFSDAEIEYADSELLRPYAEARHGSSANQMALETVRRYAKDFGRLDFIYKDEEIVACLLGVEYIIDGKRYWMADRFGYPKSVFSDPKKLSEVNSMNAQMGLEWAIENGYDFYDLTLVFARPFDGLLVWKSRRGAALSKVHLEGYSNYYVSVPKADSATFFWEAPLFSIEKFGLTLNLGFPEKISDDEFLTNYREMGFAGVNNVNIHCTKVPSENLLASFCKHYKHQSSPPKIEIVLSP